MLIDVKKHIGHLKDKKVGKDATSKAFRHALLRGLAWTHLAASLAQHVEAVGSGGGPLICTRLWISGGL